MPTLESGAGPHKKIFYKEPWFWVFIAGIVLIVIAIIIRAVQQKSNELFWITISLGVLLAFIGIILFVVWTIHPSKQAKIEKMAAESTSQHLMATGSPAVVVHG